MTNPLREIYGIPGMLNIHDAYGAHLARARPDPQAVALARRTPWTVSTAETVIEAHGRLAHAVSLDMFADAVLALGLDAVELLDERDMREIFVRGVEVHEHGARRHIHIPTRDGGLGPAIFV